MKGMPVRRTSHAALAVAAAPACAACGGGDGGGGMPPAPPPANRSPAFTNGGPVNVPENGSGVIFTATASDPDGDPLTFSLAGGADQERLQITAAGALSF
ncbi:MAG: hypothetical protein ACXWUR_06860, partial [Allosphingosinicella sp.]